MKKIFVIFLTVIYICGCIIPVFADESVSTPFDTTVYRIFFKENFDDGDSEGTANGVDFTGKHVISFKCKLNNLSHKLSIFIKTLGDFGKSGISDFFVS